VRKEKNDLFDDIVPFYYTACMSTFKTEDLIALENLAKIRILPKNTDRLVENINKILSFVEMLHEVDTENTPPLTHVIKGMKAKLAADVVKDNLPTEEFLNNAPSRIGSFLKVPVVIEGKEDV
jgi:aspartyl-tRNA(Asn)/glutamyl-tRNA(Gln) amidotransferase subunit C